MNRTATLTLLGLLAFLILLIATLPARILLDRIPAIAVSKVSGSIWSGSAESMSVQGVALGRTQWRVSALPLLRGRLDIDATVNPPDGRGAARCAVRLDQSVSCSRVVASLPLQALPLDSLPPGWTGRVDVDLSRLEIENGWPIGARGRIDVTDLQRPSGTGLTSFGSYRLVLPAPEAEAGAKEDTVVGALQDLSGPLAVNGTLTLSRDRTYVIDGRVAARPEAPRDLARSLEYLGPPDAQGRREFSLAGSL
jgi:general secretion pathway protein N